MPSVETSKPSAFARSTINALAARSSSESAARLTPPRAVAPISAIAIWRDQSLASSTAAAAAIASALASNSSLLSRTLARISRQGHGLRRAPRASRAKPPCVSRVTRGPALSARGSAGMVRPGERTNGSVRNERGGDRPRALHGHER